MTMVTPTSLQGEWSPRYCTNYFRDTGTNMGPRLKLINNVSSGNTAKIWSCHSTTPNFSSTSTSTLIGTPQMHVSHAASFSTWRTSTVQVFCTVCIHMSIAMPLTRIVSPVWVFDMLRSDACRNKTRSLWVYVHGTFYHVIVPFWFTARPSAFEGQSMTLVIWLLWSQHGDVSPDPLSFLEEWCSHATQWLTDWFVII